MEVQEIIGRNYFKSLLDNALEENKASLVTVYGGRRVGKTFLIKPYLHNQLSFQYLGIHYVTSEIQLGKFTGRWQPN